MTDSEGFKEQVKNRPPFNCSVEAYEFNSKSGLVCKAAASTANGNMSPITQTYSKYLL